MKYVLFLLLLGLLYIGCSGTDKNQQQAKKVLYTCPMHPQIIQDHPGVCPICHMDLVVKTESADSGSSIASVVDLSSNELFLANLRTIVVKKEQVNKEIKAFSTLDFADENKRTISARFNGRIEKLFANKSGEFIQKGTPLFEIYSPEIIQAQNDFLLSESNEKLAAASKEKLLLLGISERQIDELKRSQKINNTIIYYSPYSGTIMEKKVQEGMYVNEGSALYDLADFSTIWNIADVYEADLGQIKNGSSVSFSVQAYPGETFTGKVNLIYPVVDPKNRTVKVRSVINNKGGKLKPNMFGETTFESGSKYSITIPAESILMTGNRNLVYIKTGKGKFQARDITLGFKYGNNYEVLSGLNENEEIAYSGAYLVDSESQLRGITK